ncbi:Signal transduction histidine-protein kinase AtoS [Polaromonas vacuolata]|uniref:histidine kinase n=1 Tax=Polaromonas vacuolata TaxID=37448 RepID=A0A6H2H9N7_9BURK|nr:PAS domain S-box protein [Polaromonas vacuolata]QJC56591.1 Signal transduction histidine-protein kinase AtoS [Polaromonas vacuolata]
MATRREWSNILLSSDKWQEHLYDMLLESIPSSVLLVDRSLRVMSANRNFLEKARRDERSTIGASLNDVFPTPILEFTRVEEKVRRVFEQGELLRGEQITYRAPGIPTRMYYYTVVPVKADGRVECAMILMDDITEKVRLVEQAHLVQARLANVVEYANDLLVSADIAGCIVTWNPAAERATGFSSREVQGRAMVDLCDPADREDMRSMIQQMARGQMVSSRELRLVARSGALIPVAWAFSSMRDEAGKVSALVAVGRDLTERHTFEAQLAQNVKLAALGVMAGGIAHELRNPLSVSYSAAQFLKDGAMDPAFQEECIQKILDGINRASGIIENLLRFSRPSEGGNMKVIDLVPVVRETVRLLSNQGALQKVSVSEDYPAGSILINGNTSQLQQVLMNLIVNAYAAMSKGGDLKIAIRSEGGRVTVFVRDTGSGIAESNTAKIFDPFFTTKGAGGGTGLGLSICHTIISQHQGRIDVDSKIGQGSTFTVSLPAR